MSGIKPDVTIEFFDPDFPYDAKISAIRVHLMKMWVINIFMYFQDCGLKWKFLGGKMEEGVVQRWSPTNSFLLFGVFTSVPILVKIDQEMRPWECSQRDTHRDTHTDTNRFYNLSHVICYSYGTDNNTKIGHKASSLPLCTQSALTVSAVVLGAMSIIGVAFVQHEK